MPRKNFIRTTQYFYHVYNRSNQKIWYTCSMDRVWDIAINSLAKANSRHPIQIAQFVLMQNHYHMLVRTPNGNLDKFMYEFGKNFSLGLRIETHLINRMFSGRYKWSVIAHEQYLRIVYNYIYQNPIRAGLSDDIHNYPYSTAFRHFNEKKISIIILYHQESANAPVALIKNPVLIARGLKKTYFSPPSSS